MSEKRSYSSCYKTFEVLGKGEFSTVRKCLSLADHKFYAVKIINKTLLSKNSLVLINNEIISLKKLNKLKNNNYMIQLYDLFEDNKYIRLILDLCYGNNLYDYLIKQNHIKNNNNNSNDIIVPLKFIKKISKIMYQLTTAIGLCHKLNIVHRDLKPENIMFTSFDNKTIKLIDFGLSHNKNTRNGLMKSKYGSANYVSPEIILDDYYSYKCDYWSLGVIFYVLLTGTFPFYTNTGNKNNLFKKIINCDYSMDYPIFNSVPEEAKHLLSHLLVVNPKKRFGYKKIISHPFITKYNKQETKEI